MCIYVSNIHSRWSERGNDRVRSSGSQRDKWERIDRQTDRQKALQTEVKSER